MLDLIVESTGFSFSLDEASRAAVKRESGLLRLSGVPATVLGEKNANGRTYARETMDRALSAARASGAFGDRRFLCTASGHPDGSFPNPTSASHIVTDARTETRGGRSMLVLDWLVMDTAEGKNLRALIEAGASVGTSIRGLGRQDEATGEVKDYEFLGCDAVGQPSAGTYARFDGKGVKAEAAPDAPAPKAEELDVARARRATADRLAEAFARETTGATVAEVLPKFFKLEADAAAGGLPLDAFAGLRERVSAAVAEAARGAAPTTEAAPAHTYPAQAHAHGFTTWTAPHGHGFAPWPPAYQGIAPAPGPTSVAETAKPVSPAAFGALPDGHPSQARITDLEAKLEAATKLIEALRAPRADAAAAAAAEIIEAMAGRLTASRALQAAFHEGIERRDAALVRAGERMLRLAKALETALTEAARLETRAAVLAELNAALLAARPVDRFAHVLTPADPFLRTLGEAGASPLSPPPPARTATRPVVGGWV